MAQYIDKSTIKEWLEKLEDEAKIYPSSFDCGRLSVCKELMNFLDTIETKEVDFDNDLVEEVYSHLDGIKDTADRMTSGNFMHHRAAIKFSANVIEKVLGLIGLKVQKGE